MNKILPLFLTISISIFCLNSHAKKHQLTNEEKKFVDQNLPLLAAGDPPAPSFEVWKEMTRLAAANENEKIYDRIFSACQKSDGAGTTNCRGYFFQLFKENPRYTAEYVVKTQQASRFTSSLLNTIQDYNYQELEAIVQEGLKEKPNHKPLKRLSKLFKKKQEEVLKELKSQESQ